MKAIHIRTREKNPFYSIYETNSLDLLFIPKKEPKKEILIGFIDYSNLKGAIVSFPHHSIYARKIEDFLNGKKEFEGVPIKEEKVGEINLSILTIKKIERNYQPPYDSGHVHHYKKINLNKEFDGSTKGLVEILSTNYIIPCHSKSVFRRLSIQNPSLSLSIA